MVHFSSLKSVFGFQKKNLGSTASSFFRAKAFVVVRRHEVLMEEVILLSVTFCRSYNSC
jgi:hypothetical protein